MLVFQKVLRIKTVQPSTLSYCDEHVDKEWPMLLRDSRGTHRSTWHHSGYNELYAIPLVAHMSDL